MDENNEERDLLNNKKELEILSKINENLETLLTSHVTKPDINLTQETNFKGEEIAREDLKDISISIYEKDISFSGENIMMSQDIYYAQKLGLKLRYIQAELRGGQLVFDGNKFRSSSGHLKFNPLSLGLGDMVRGIVRKNSSESFFMPSIKGVGTLQLKDTVKYLYMIKCLEPRKFILEQGVYASSAGQFSFGVHADTKMGSVIFSDKKILQTKVEGRGILILELPVPPSELVVLKVTPDRPVRVNEQEVLYREGDVSRNKRLASGLFGSYASGAGFVEEYTGNGIVVLAPTLDLVNIISNDFGEEAVEEMSSKKTLSMFKKLLPKNITEDED